MRSERSSSVRCLGEPHRGAGAARRSTRPVRAMLTVLLAALLLATLGGGCASMVSNATSDLADSLSASILSHDDPETVRQGAPAYLLMIDSLIARDPDNPELLLAGARLYGSYSGAFVQDPERARTLSARARDYGLRALCTVEKGLCRASSMPYPELEQAVAGVGSSHVPQLYGAAAAWATWVQARRDDWVAVADKARVEVMMQRVLDLDEGYLDGSAHLYLGVLDLLLPGALGGRPEQGRQHLERAIELSGGRDLMAKVLLARDYARMVFDRELHDRLCREVLDADPRQGKLTLSNNLAQVEAGRLIAAADEYFGTGSPVDGTGSPVGGAPEAENQGEEP